MLLGWIGNTLIISGAWCIGHKWRVGFLLATIGGVCWLSEGVRLSRMDLVFIEAVMAFIAIRNYIKWGMSNEKHRRK